MYIHLSIAIPHLNPILKPFLVSFYLLKKKKKRAKHNTKSQTGDFKVNKSAGPYNQGNRFEVLRMYTSFRHIRLLLLSP